MLKFNKIYFLVIPMPTKITIELPTGISKEEVLKEIGDLIKLKKYEVNEGFKLLNDYDKKRALKIAEFVENYLKKHYPKVKFKIGLEYDDFEDEINVKIIFKSKLSSDERLKILDEIDKAIFKNFGREEIKKIYVVYNIG